MRVVVVTLYFLLLSVPPSFSQRLLHSALTGAKETPFAIGVDRAGNAYVAGTLIYGYRSVGGATVIDSDVFVSKYSSDGTRLYHRVIGGSGQESAAGFVVDAEGNAYFTGTTASTDFSTTPGAWRTAPTASGQNSFLVKLDASGECIFATYVWASARALAVDRQGRALIAATGDAVLLLKLKADGSDIEWTGRFGGGGEEARTVALDTAGNIYLAGNTPNNRLPVTPGVVDSDRSSGTCRGFGFFAQPFPCPAAWVAKLDPEAKNVSYATYLSWTAATTVNSIAVDGGGSVYVTGTVQTGPVDDNFRTTPGAFQPTIKPNLYGPAAFVVKLSPAADRLEYSTYLAGNMSDAPGQIVLDPEGRAIVTGVTISSDFPATGAWANGCGPSYPANRPSRTFVSRLSADGSRLESSVVLTSSLQNGPLPAVALDSAGAAWVATSALPGVPLTVDSGDIRAMNSLVGYLARLDFAPSPALACITNGADFRPSDSAAPGQLLTLFGAGLGPETLAFHDPATGPAPFSLAGTRILFDGEPAPILAAVSTQVNTIVPQALSGRDSARMDVEVNGDVVATFLLPLTALKPVILGRFSDELFDRSSVRADAFNEDGAPNTWENAAAYKSVVEFYATGVGPLDGVGGDDSVVGGRRPMAPLRVWIYDNEAEVVEAVTVEGRTNAVVRVRARVPDVCCGGNLRLRLRSGEQASEINGPIIVVR